MPGLIAAVRREIQTSATHERGAQQFLARATAVAMLALGGLFVSLVSFHGSRADAAHEALQSATIGRIARDAELAAEGRESAVRESFLTGDRQPLRADVDARAVVTAKLDTLYALSEHFPERRANVRAIRATLDRTASAGVGSGTSLDEIRNAFHRFVDAENVRYDKSVMRYETTASRSALAMTIEITVLAIVLIFFRRRLRADIQRSAEANHLLVAQNTRLEEQRITLEDNAEQLQDQSMELESTLDEAHTSQRQLEETTKLFQAVLENLPVTVVAMDLDGKVFLWNSAAERLLGWRADEAVGNTNPLSTSAMAPEFFQLQADVLREGRILNRRTQRMRKDGTLVEVTLSAATFRDTAGGVTGYIVVASDLTDWLQLEAQFRQAQKMEAVGRLAGGVAHDFNNLLTVIGGNTDLVLMSHADDADVEPLREVQGAVDRAAALTRQLLAFSRQQVNRPHVLALNQIVEDAAALLRRLLGEDVDLRCMLSDGLNSIRADPVQIQQVLLNLAVNARDAMPRGGMVTIETANAELDAAFPRRPGDPVLPGRYISLRVSDTGMGMPPEVREQIFEPFFTTKETGKGTGLGLSTVHGIVQQSGGHIFVYSEPGLGTTFKLYFPAVTGVPEPLQATVPNRPDRGAGETILLVEDDHAVRRIARTILESHGYRIVEAAEGADGLVQCARDGTIALVITDVVMPVMGGRDFAREVRARRPNMPIVFVSGYTAATLSGHELANEASAFLEKPFTAEGLTRTVGELLGRRSSTAR